MGCHDKYVIVTYRKLSLLEDHTRPTSSTRPLNVSTYGAIFAESPASD